MSRSLSDRQTLHLHLSDGRKLVFAQWGDLGGAPLMLFHGWPGSRLVGLLLEEAARSMGVWLITVDRPGIGRSDLQPGRTIPAWCDDVSCLADHLGIDRFAVAGLSGGAPYALACARRIPERLIGTALISGMAPPDEVERSLPLAARGTMALARFAPRLAELPVGLMAFSLRRAPGLYAKQALAGAPPADHQVLRRPAVFAALKAEHEEAFRQGNRGPTVEVALLARPWGFELKEVTAPVHLFHGEEDRNIPVSAARQVARRLPRCRARFFPGAGHLCYVDSFDVVLRALLS